MPTPLDGDVEQQGALELTSPVFDDGDQMPDSTGYVNENANLQLDISGAPTRQQP